MRMFRICWSLFIFYFFAISAFATTSQLTAVQDAGIVSGSGYSDQHFGSSTYLVGNWSTLVVGLLRFDLQAIPSNAHVTGANLRLFFDNNSQQYTVWDLFRVTTSWQESAVTWNTRPNVSDYMVSRLAINDANTQVFYNWNVLDVVQGWVRGDYGNYGLWLQRTSNPYYASWPYIMAREATTPAHRPLLTVNYDVPPVPEPSSLLMLGGSTVALLGAARKRR